MRRVDVRGRRKPVQHRLYDPEPSASALYRYRRIGVQCNFLPGDHGRGYVHMVEQFGYCLDRAIPEFGAGLPLLLEYGESLEDFF